MSGLTWFRPRVVQGDIDLAAAALAPLGVKICEGTRCSSIPSEYWYDTDSRLWVKEIGMVAVLADSGVIWAHPRGDARPSEIAILLGEAEKALTDKRPAAGTGWHFQRRSTKREQAWWCTIIVPAEDDDPFMQMVARVENRRHREWLDMHDPLSVAPS